MNLTASLRHPSKKTVRRNINDTAGYLDSHTENDAGADLFKLVGPTMSVGPLYLPNTYPKDIISAIAVDMRHGAPRMYLSRNVARLVKARCIGIQMPTSYEMPRRVVDLCNPSQEAMMTPQQYQDYVMLLTNRWLYPEHHWNPTLRCDDSTPRIEDLNDKTRALKGRQETWLDYDIRSIPSGNLTKLDLDRVVYNPETYAPLLLAEVKLVKNYGVEKRLNWDITRYAGAKMKVPAGCVSYFDAHIKRDGSPYRYNLTGFGIGDTDLDFTIVEAAALLRGLIYGEKN